MTSGRRGGVPFVTVHQISQGGNTTEKLPAATANFERPFTPRTSLRSPRNFGNARFRRFATFDFSTSIFFWQNLRIEKSNLHPCRPQFYVHVDLNFTSMSTSILRPCRTQFYVHVDLNFTSMSTSILRPIRPQFFCGLMFV